MSILLAHTRDKGAEFYFYNDCIEVKYSVCIKNVLAEVIQDYCDALGISTDRFIKSINNNTSLIPSKHNWYLTKRAAASTQCELLSLAGILRRDVEQYRWELEGAFEDEIKTKLYTQFINHNK